MSNKNAYLGSLNEKIFAREVQKNPQTIHEIVKVFTTQLPKRGLRIKLVETEGQHGEKSDVFIRTTGGHNFGANVKSYKGVGFNQVTRMPIDRFADQFAISNNIRTILKDLTIEKAKDSRKNWITKEYSEMIIRELKPKAYDIVRISLLGEDSPQLFVLLKTDEQIIRIYKMDDVLDYLHNSIKVKVTSRGVLMLNECFSIQKKGGNGKHEKYSKLDIRHGGNNVQVKVKTGLLASKVLPITSLSY